MAIAQAGLVDVVCPRCGAVRRLTERQHRRGRAEGSLFICGLCRGRRKITVTDAHRRYWLDRFSMDEIVDLATCIWGEDLRDRAYR